MLLFMAKNRVKRGERAAYRDHLELAACEFPLPLEHGLLGFSLPPLEPPREIHYATFL